MQGEWEWSGSLFNIGNSKRRIIVTGKDILNAAITELDALITRVEAGEELDETTLEAAVAKVNQAIDEFKNSKYYNLSIDTTHLTFDQAADLILYYKKLAEESHE